MLESDSGTHPQMALTAEMRTDGGWLSWRPLTVACRNCWMSSGDMAAVKRLAAHRARPSRNGDAAGRDDDAQKNNNKEAAGEITKARSRFDGVISFFT